MNRRKIGPGVYATGPLGEIEMEAHVIRSRLERGLSIPPRKYYIGLQGEPPEIIVTDSVDNLSHLWNYYEGRETPLTHVLSQDPLLSAKKYADRIQLYPPITLNLTTIYQRYISNPERGYVPDH